MRVVLLDVEPEGWGNNANRVTPIDLQQKVQEITKMNLSSQRHGNLYKSEEILHVHEEV
jgi:hypothetical protein